MSLFTTGALSSMRRAVEGTMADQLTIYAGSQAKVGTVAQAAQWTENGTLKARLLARTPAETFQAWGEEVKEPWEAKVSVTDAARVKANDRLAHADGRWFRVVAVRPPSGVALLSGLLLLERVRALEVGS